MELIFLALTLLILLINLAGVALIGLRVLGKLENQDCGQTYAITRMAGTLLFCITLFFIEHQFGLGKLNWLWPMTTLASGYLIYRDKELFFKGLWKTELVFVLGLLYGLLWKVAFPDIDAGSEALTDLAFISNYHPGTHLPPVDHWLSGYAFNFYYAFQHYCAALMGRILGLGVGFTYNLACAVILAFMVSLTWAVVSTWAKNVALKMVLLIAVIAGGTGVSPFAPFLYTYPNENTEQQAYASTSRLWASVRYIGKYDASVNTEWGLRVIGKGADTNLERPLETIGYLTFLSDYHAPLGSFTLLLLALACIFRLEREDTSSKEQSWLQGILVATGPLVLITNTWVVPLQTSLVFSWIGYRYIRKRSLDFKAILLGGLTPLILAYPFLSEFAAQALSTPLKLVASGEHTQFSQWLFVLWPQLVLMILALFAIRRLPLVGFFLFLGMLYLGLSELVYLDDPLGGKYNRFNSSLKWWSWTQVLLLTGVGALLLSSQARKLRWVALIPLLAVGSYSIELGNNWLKSSKVSLGKLHGHQWLTKDGVNRQIVEYLTSAPPGVVLEGLDRMAYTPSSAIALFANKPSFAGWPGHEQQWRGGPEFINQRGVDTQQFYRGELENSQGWLLKNLIRYVVWRKTDHQKHSNGPDVWRKITEQIADEYYWIPIHKQGSEQFGIWQWKGER